MPLQTGDQTIDTALLDSLRRLAGGGRSDQQLISKQRSIQESAVHDFSTYQFLFEPILQFFPNDPDPGITLPGRPPDIPVDIWVDFEDFVSRFQTHVQGLIAQTILVSGSKLNEDLSGSVLVYEPTTEESRIVQPLAVDGSQAFRIGLAPILFDAYRATSESERFLQAAREVVQNWIQSTLAGMRAPDNTVQMSDLNMFRQATFWKDAAQPILDQLALLNFAPLADKDDETVSRDRDFGEVLPSSFPFDPFLPGSVNFGLQVIYRQGWRPLGTQPGEIVRTLPLGPKQSEKVTVKAIRRTKATRQAEVSTSIETSTESSAATKDSSEVVQEASESFNWHVEASASASFGFGSASLTAGMGGENASSSRDTKAMLNETMEKTASKIRKDTKIIVSTETEETSEFSQVSEIVNSNDEIAVTYIYSRLQRQYEIYTYLSEVNMVVFVAEHIPSPTQIDGAWIRRYDWIIARELLDESYKTDLDVVRNYSADVGEQEDIDGNIRRLMENYSGEGAGGIPDYSGVPGTIPDMFRTPQQAYEREVERQRARDADDLQYFSSLRRLRAHIFDNILHYCRAIWSAEDPSTRLLRFRNIRVPRKYQAIASGAVGDGGARVTISPAVTDPERDTIPLSEIINPAGPIGFAGNYAVYFLKESPRWQSLINIIDTMMMPYRPIAATIAREEIADAVKLEVIVSPFRDGGGDYRIVKTAGNDAPFSVFRRAAGTTYEIVDSAQVRFDGQHLFFHALKINIGGLDQLQVGSSFNLRLTVLPQLEDPELKAVTWRADPLDRNSLDQIFSPEIIDEMRGYFADVEREFREVVRGASWNVINPNQKNLLVSRYYHYLLRKRHTRLLVIDTNNILLTREVDDATTLEPYKEVHRLLDALKAVEDVRQQATESERRKKRVDIDALGDPDIERVTVVATAKDLANLAALDGLDNNDPLDRDGSDGPDDGG